ncbi:tetratricopeptide repeat protein [Hespellia stercorisuis]|uniref:TPR repeat-containing protein n=1 Tax=Hespellia stercorisuis DSM 15480 TaxID=1121950 RepID=A0A1M6LBD5_9FIRM|nr:tetratricopeptide repeat protein [Hespellia stercorisuis]SHJ68521.1 TPR repeat-containing protein [Hespellia stercorisuis DSM 15480]
MKKFLIVLTVLMSCMLVGCTSKVADGVKLMEEGSYQGAVDKFQEAIDKGKNAGEAYRGQGMAYYELGDYASAQGALESALNNGVEETPIIYNMLGICYMKQDDMESAFNNFNLGIAVADELAGDDETDYSKTVQEMKYNIIICYEKQLDWESAKTKMAEYMIQYPDDTDAQKEAQFLETR